MGRPTQSPRSQARMARSAASGGQSTPLSQRRRVRSLTPRRRARERMEFGRGSPTRPPAGPRGQVETAAWTAPSVVWRSRAVASVLRRFPRLDAWRRWRAARRGIVMGAWFFIRAALYRGGGDRVKFCDDGYRVPQWRKGFDIGGRVW
jgi:hypothetical protein